jgi:hypothetical protein
MSKTSCSLFDFTESRVDLVEQRLPLARSCDDHLVAPLSCFLPPSSLFSKTLDIYQFSCLDFHISTLELLYSTFQSVAAIVMNSLFLLTLGINEDGFQSSRVSELNLSLCSSLLL